MDHLYELHAHHLDKVVTLWNVDPDRYSLLELQDDCYKYLIRPMYGDVGGALTIHHELPVSKLRIELSSDIDVLDMFEFHNSKKAINIVVDLEKPININGDKDEDAKGEGVEGDGDEGAEGDGEGEGAQGAAEGEGHSNSQEDNVYGFSSEDEEWNASEEDNSESVTNGGDDGLVDENVVDMGIGIEKEKDKEREKEKQKQKKYCNRSDDGLSDYSSNNSGHSSSDSDFFDKDGEENVEGEYYGRTKGKGIRKKKQKEVVLDLSKFGIVFERGNEPKFKLERFHIFENVHHFREILKDYAIQEGFRLKRVKNEKKRVTCRCATEGCPWRIHASPLPDLVTYMIKTLNDVHDCVKVRNNREATASWLAKKFEKNFQENPELTVKGFKGAIRGSFGLIPKRTKLYRAKEKAMEKVEGSHEASYKLLPPYANEAIKSNPGSVVKFNHWRPDLNLNPTFRRIFISFEAMRTGFKMGCRPFIGLDGCHLKGPYGGVLLSAIALDANNGLFPVAIAVVESERKDSWSFFLQHLSTVMEADTVSKPWTFMSDMQKGLDTALVEVIPQANHRICCRHLYNAYKKKNPGIMLRQKFWNAVRAYNAVEFKKAMDQMKGMSREAHDWLMNNFELSSWARHAFNPDVKSDHVTNNISESFNNWVGDLRLLPLLSCLDGIRAKLMERIHKRYQQGCTWNGLVTPNIRKRLNKAIEDGRSFNVMVAGRGEFEVQAPTVRYIVNLTSRTCDCRGWQISGIPCTHAAAAICFQREKIEAFCDPCFTIESYMKIHEGIIHPIPDQQMWEPYTGVPLDPPPPRRLPGRPKKNRKRTADEPPRGTNMAKRSHVVRCHNCNMMGHNRRGCQRAPTMREQRENMEQVSQRASQSRPNTQQREKGRSIPSAQRGRERSIPSAQRENMEQVSQRASQSRPNTQQRGRGRSISSIQRGSGISITSIQGGNETTSTSTTQGGSSTVTGLAQRRVGSSTRPGWGRGTYIPVFGQLGSIGSGVGGSQNPRTTSNEDLN